MGGFPATALPRSRQDPVFRLRATGRAAASRRGPECRDAHRRNARSPTLGLSQALAADKRDAIAETRGPAFATDRRRAKERTCAKCHRANTSGHGVEINRLATRAHDTSPDHSTRSSSFRCACESWSAQITTPFAATSCWISLRRASAAPRRNFCESSTNFSPPGRVQTSTT